MTPDEALDVLLAWLPERCTLRGVTHTHNGPCPEEAHDALARHEAAIRAEYEAKLAALRKAIGDLPAYTRPGATNPWVEYAAVIDLFDREAAR